MYSQEFRENAVRKALEPGGPTIGALTQELGLGHNTVSRWIAQAGSVGGMSRRKMPGRRPNDRTPAEKLRLVNEASALSDQDLGEFLRKNGIHSAQLEQWRKDAMAGLGAPPRQPSGKQSPESKKIRELERELRRKDAALAETAALLVLKKKAQAIWGDGEDDTMPRNGK
jgi:transposase